MQLDYYLARTQNVLENLGYWRFSAFYSAPLVQKEQIQKVSRLIVSIFAMISAYDLMFPTLNFTAKVVIHGSLLLLISCLGLSLLLKKVQQFFNLSDQSHLHQENLLLKTPSLHKGNSVGTPLSTDLLIEEMIELEKSSEKTSEMESAELLKKDHSEISFKQIKRRLLPEFEKVANLTKRR